MGFVSARVLRLLISMLGLGGVRPVNVPKNFLRLHREAKLKMRVSRGLYAPVMRSDCLGGPVLRGEVGRGNGKFECRNPKLARPWQSRPRVFLLRKMRR